MGIAFEQVREPVRYRIPSRFGLETKTGRAPPEAAEEKWPGTLPALLSRMGLTGQAYEVLVSREDLQADPSPALAWWWYALTQEEVHPPAALAVQGLVSHCPPQAHYLDLARAWPQVSAGDRFEIEETLRQYPDSQKMAARWSAKYPGLSQGAMAAFMWLYAAAPQELGYPQAMEEWAGVFAC